MECQVRKGEKREKKPREGEKEILPWGGGRGIPWLKNYPGKKKQF